MAVLLSALTIGGVVVDISRSAHDLNINIEYLPAYELKRASNGDGVLMTSAVAGKRKISFSAKGHFPPDLSAVDFTAAVAASWVQKDGGGGTVGSANILAPEGLAVSYDSNQFEADWSVGGEEV